MLHGNRHRRRNHVGGVAGDDQVDAIDIEQLAVDPRHGGAAALVVIIDELDRSPEQAAGGIDVLRPYLRRQQGRLTGAGESAGERHAEANANRLGRLGGGEPQGA